MSIKNLDIMQGFYTKDDYEKIVALSELMPSPATLIEAFEDYDADCCIYTNDDYMDYLDVKKDAVEILRIASSGSDWAPDGLSSFDHNAKYFYHDECGYGRARSIRNSEYLYAFVYDGVDFDGFVDHLIRFKPDYAEDPEEWSDQTLVLIAQAVREYNTDIDAELLNRAEIDPEELETIEEYEAAYDRAIDLLNERIQKGDE